MSNCNNISFPDIFNDIVKGTYPYEHHSNTSLIDDQELDVPEVDIREYEQLKSDFKAYKARIEKQSESDKKDIKKQLFRDFINNYVVYMINVYKEKNTHNLMKDDDYMILDKLNSFLTDNGITPMEDSTGKAFNYEKMEALYTVNINDSFKHNLVAKVVYNGFMMDGEVLLPQKVAVYNNSLI